MLVKYGISITGENVVVEAYFRGYTVRLHTKSPALVGCAALTSSLSGFTATRLHGYVATWQ